MDYKEMWERLKQDLIEGVNEGLEKGFDNIHKQPYENGMYEAYRRTLDTMENIENWDEDDEL